LAVTILGGVGGTVVVGLVVLRHLVDFSHPLHAAPVLVLIAAVALQVVALLARTEAWHQCVGARRGLYRAAGIGSRG